MAERELPPEIDLSIDPRRANQIAIFGRKGEGKSELAYHYWRSFPGNRICVDTTGDVWEKHPVKDAIRWGYRGESSMELPARFPEPLADDERVTVFYKPDPGAPTWREDVDHVVGLAYAKEGTMLWIEEVGEIFQVGKTGPHGRRALHQGRHQRLNLIMTGPRPMNVELLVLGNADIVCCFDMPQPADRKRVADNIGLPPQVLDEAIAALHSHEYFAYTANPRAWAIMPPLPIGQRASKRSA